MSTGYQIYDQRGYYFLTFQVVEWTNIFNRVSYRDIVIESFKYCVAHKHLRVHAWVIMSNHIHCILSSEKKNLSDIIRDLKSFSSKQMLLELQNGAERRRVWLEMIFRYAARGHNRNKYFQIWTHENHAVELHSMEFLSQKLNYIHNNPVRARIVASPEHYLDSSALDYYHQKQIGPIPISFFS